MVLHRDVILPSLSTYTAGHSSGVPPGCGQAAAARARGTNSPCRETRRRKDLLLAGCMAFGTWGWPFHHPPFSGWCGAPGVAR